LPWQTCLIADANITAWNDKVFYVYWRPAAIQLGHTYDNSQTAGDPSWLPLIVTPAYLDYTSGANNVTSALNNTFRLFFGTNKMTFSITTTNTGPTNQDTRTYSRFSEVTYEVVDARV
jgi:hypothetical protein